MSGSRTSRTSRRRAAAPPRERLLAAADDLFYHRGIHNVGIDEIIATAGVAKASLYNHFASKDELIAEYVRGRSDAWWAWFHERVEDGSETAEGRLRAVFDALGEWLDERGFRGCALQNAGVELADRRHAGHRVAVAGKRSVRAYLAELAAAAGHAAPEALAEQLALLFEGAIVTALLEGSAAPARAARAAAEKLLQ